MTRISLIQLRATWKRLLAVIIAIVIGVAFMTASLLSGSLMDAQLRNSVATQINGADVVITSNGGELTEGMAEEATSIDGVVGAGTQPITYGKADGVGGLSMVMISPISNLPAVKSGMKIVEGRLPEQPGEIVLTDTTVSRAQVAVGDSMRWSPVDEAQGEPMHLTVVGIVKGGAGISLNAADGFISREQYIKAIRDSQIPSILVEVAPGADRVAVAREVQAKLGDQVQARDVDAFVQDMVKAYSGGMASIRIVLGVFALIAMFAGGLVIANTFQISIAQRTHDLAMLRCIGADRRQIRRSVLTEALVIGGVASLIGVAIGSGLIWLANFIVFDAQDRAPSIGMSPWVLVVGVVFGTLVTMASAWIPARNATRVHPLQALRSAAVADDDQVPERMRGIVTAALNVGGVVLLAAGYGYSRFIDQGNGVGLMLGVLGGMLSFLGLLLASRYLVPLLLRGFGHITAAVFGMPGELANANLARNAGRTSATSAALILGVTLVVMCTVGASTLSSTFVSYFNERSVVDLAFQFRQRGATTDALTDSDRNRVALINGVAALTPFWQKEVTLSGGTSVEKLTVQIVDQAGLNETSRSSSVRDLADGEILVNPSFVRQYDLHDGETMTLEWNGTTTPVSVRTSEFLGNTPIVSVGTIRSLGDPGAPTGLWVKLTDDVAANDVVKRVKETTPGGVSVTSNGSAHDREVNLRVMDQLLSVATALLGAAVVIAIVGIGNTLTLSVLERTRESGVLRAIGLTGRQLRRTLAIEGVLLALVGTIIGLLAGTLYGWIGAATLFGDSFPVAYSLPLVRFIGIVAIAFLCGGLASVFPARRAVRVKPVEALATVG